MKPMKKVVAFHSLCGVGKASLTNMIPILSVMGVEVCPIPTILLSTHTGGYGAPAMCPVSGAYIENVAKHYRDNKVAFDAIFIGYLGSEEMVSSVRYFINQFPETPVILDPIMGDHGKFYQNLGPTYASCYNQLLACADIVLPNFTEACFLAHDAYIMQPDAETLSYLCGTLKDKGAKNIIVTSVPTTDSQKGIAIFEGEKMETLSLGEVIGDFHGAGDVFDAVFLGAYLQGFSLKSCVEKAHTFVCECILESNKYDYPEREGLLIERCISLLV